MIRTIWKRGKRHNLPSIKVIDESAKMTSAAGRFAGLDRFAARKQVVAELEKLGLLEKVEPYKLSVGQCHRCKTVVEPLVSMQWWVKIKPIADPAIKAVEDGRIQFVPANWAKTYFDWMYNIRDWCISRQLWWGHRIPAWHCANCGGTTVARETPAVCAKCGSDRIEQDTDVLRYVVQLRAVAVLYAGVAGSDGRSEGVLSDDASGDRVRHYFFLGGADDHARD